MSVPMTSPPPSPCIFCQIAQSPTTTATLLHSLLNLDRTRRLSHSRTSILLHSGHGLRASHALGKVSPGGTRKFLLRDLLEQTLCRNSSIHYLVIPIEHIPTVRDLKRREEDYNLVTHMLKVGQTLLQQDAPQSKQHRFGFHQPPFNSVNHLHLHCLALPFIPKWKQVKYMPLGPSAGFIEAEKLLNRIKPE